MSSLRADDVAWSPEEEAELLATIEAGADRLDALIANLLDLSRLQAGPLAVHLLPVAVDEVVARALIHERDVDAAIDIPDDLPLVLSDPGLLERVVANVVDNARRYSPPGRVVRIRASVRGAVVVLEVVDHGPGVPEPHPGRRADHDPDPPAGCAVTRILVVDDDPTLLRALTINLRARHYDVDAVATGGAALRHAANHPDVVVLDLGLPDLDGVDVVRGLRGWSAVPIIVLSARDAQAAKVDALDAGADDYVTKPFGMDELLARIRAALRRAAPGIPAPVVVTESFTVDLANRRVTRDGANVRLTPTEWQLLGILVRNPEKLMTHRELLTEVWGPGFEDQANYLRVYMAQLRRKLEAQPSRPRHLLTEPGIGYRFALGEARR